MVSLKKSEIPRTRIIYCILKYGTQVLHCKGSLGETHLQMWKWIRFENRNQNTENTYHSSSTHSSNQVTLLKAFIYFTQENEWDYSAVQKKKSHMRVGSVSLSYEIKFGGSVMKRDRAGRLWIQNFIHFYQANLPKAVYKHTTGAQDERVEIGLGSISRKQRKRRSMA